MLSNKSYLVGAAAVFLIIVIAALSDLWPLWVGGLLLLLLVIGGLVLKQLNENKRLYVLQQPVYHPPPPSPPVPPASIAVHGLALPSAQRDYRFFLQATILWRHSGTHGVPHSTPDQLALDAIRERATVLTAQEPAADIDLLTPRLAADLSSPLPDRTGLLKVWAENATLFLPDEDRERLDKLANARKDEEVWEYELAHERKKRAFLREEVLSTTGSAVVWWLARDASRVQETVDLIDTLAKLVAAAQDREVEPVFRTFVNNLTDPSPRTTTDDDDFVDRLMAEILPNGSEPERADLADRLAALATEAGATDLAGALRERFNAPDFTAAPNLFDSPENEPSPIHSNGQAEPGTPPNSP